MRILGFKLEFYVLLASYKSQTILEGNYDEYSK